MKGNVMNLTNRAMITDSIINNLVRAGVLLDTETARYRELLDTYKHSVLLEVLVASHELNSIVNPCGG